MSDQKLEARSPFKSKGTLINILVHLMCLKLGQHVCVHEISNELFIWVM